MDCFLRFCIHSSIPQWRRGDAQEHHHPCPHFCPLQGQRTMSWRRLHPCAIMGLARDTQGAPHCGNEWPNEWGHKGPGVGVTRAHVMLLLTLRTEIASGPDPHMSPSPCWGAGFWGRNVGGLLLVLFHIPPWEALSGEDSRAGWPGLLQLGLLVLLGVSSGKLVHSPSLCPRLSN